ncbi:hypothetical protein D915_010252 [Fasciola hepatica]|uniref:Uncharacterized protein n=1 Tax=Fasciola hepatica TaxID=6192 RepID=A0A4E0R9D8_FASHE|nr:hypothetical protein D915_010252 [Fasciola hepatica]
MCRTKAGLTLHRKLHPESATEPAPLDTSPQKAFPCTICSQSFDTQVGCSQHMRHRHPTERTKEILKKIAPVRQQWSSSEKATLISLANQMVSNYSEKKAFYDALADYFNPRSAESIKKRLQMLRWEAPDTGCHFDSMNKEVAVQPHCSDTPPSPMVSPVPSTHSPASTQSRCYMDSVSERLLEVACSLLRSSPSGTFGSQELQMAESALYQSVSLEALRHGLDVHAETYVTHLYNSTVPRSLCGIPISTNSKSRRRNNTKFAERKVEHVGIQQLFAHMSELRSALKDMKGCAAGVDCVTPEDLLQSSLPIFAAYMNILLAAAHIPPRLNTARVSFIPRSDHPSSPSDYQLISISPCILRAFHEVLERRWTSFFVANRLQFTFLKSSECFEATALLHAILRHAHSSFRSLSFAYLPLSMAFESLSHDVVVRSAALYGAPPLLQNYLRSSCDTASSILPDGTCVKPVRGVRQGDPLWPLILTMTIDQILSDSRPDLAFSSPAGPIGAIAHTDEIILLADSDEQLQMKLDSCHAACSLAGLSIDTDKSFSASIICSGKHKLSALAQTTFTVKNSPIRMLTPSDSFHFLNVEFTFRGKADVDYVTIVESMLNEIVQAPLHPYQRLQILRRYLISRLRHGLCLGVIHKKSLKKLDHMCRKCVRDFLELPSDAPTAFFHARCSDGGLGIPNFSSSIPLIFRDHVKHLRSSTSPQVRWASECPAAAASLKIGDNSCWVQGTEVQSSSQIVRAWKMRLYDSRDRRSIRSQLHSIRPHKWLTMVTEISPDDFLQNVKFQCSLFTPKTRHPRSARILEDTSQ